MVFWDPEGGGCDACTVKGKREKNGGKVLSWKEIEWITYGKRKIKEHQVCSLCVYLKIHTKIHTDL